MKAPVRLRTIVEPAHRSVGGAIQVGARDDILQHGEPAGARHRLQRFRLVLRLPPSAADVDQRRLPGHGNRLFDLTERHFRIHRGGELRPQLEAITHERAETGKSKSHSVVAGPQVNDEIHSLAVCHRDASPRDQRWARRFHGNARQNCAGRVRYHSANAALGPRGPG